MKVACVLITHLRAKVEMQRRPHLRDQPVLIADRTRSRPVVVDYFPAFKASTRHADAPPGAIRQWGQPKPVLGMPLERALSYQAAGGPARGLNASGGPASDLNREAVVLDADESHYRRVFRQVLTALQGISDRVEDAGPGFEFAYAGSRLRGPGRAGIHVRRRGATGTRAASTPFPSTWRHGRASGRESSRPWWRRAAVIRPPFSQAKWAFRSGPARCRRT